MREQAERLAWHTDTGTKCNKKVILLGKKRIGYAYSPTENTQKVRNTLNEICLRYNTWVRIWLALKAAERGDKYWLVEVKAAIKAAGENK